MPIILNYKVILLIVKTGFLPVTVMQPHLRKHGLISISLAKIKTVFESLLCYLFASTQAATKFLLFADSTGRWR